MADLVELKSIVRSFGGLRALKGVDFALRAGEVQALIGENGAGKVDTDAGPGRRDHAR